MALEERMGGDPGDRRLHQLAGDPIFGQLPVGATGRELQLIPARYQKPGFGSGGWNGPGVTLVFDSAEDPREVYGFYGHEAEQAGWSVAGAGSLGLTDRWRKRYANGALGTLTIFAPRPFEGGAGERRYRLAGGISLARD